MLGAVIVTPILLFLAGTFLEGSRFWGLVVQLLSRVRLFATPWTAARQASLFFTISQSLLKLMSIVSVMPSSLHFLLASSLVREGSRSPVSVFLVVGLVSAHAS